MARRTDLDRFKSATEMLLALNKLLGPNEKTFNGDNAKDLALGLVHQQKSRWDRILATLDGKKPGLNQRLANYLAGIKTTISGRPESTINVTTVEAGIAKVQSPIPLILEEPSESLLERTKSLPLLTAALLARRCASLL